MGDGSRCLNRGGRSALPALGGGLPILLNWTDYPGGGRAPNLYDTTFLLALPGLIVPRVRPSLGKADQKRRDLVLE
jgi:hypothetical protein